MIIIFIIGATTLKASIKLLRDEREKTRILKRKIKSKGSLSGQLSESPEAVQINNDCTPEEIALYYQPFFDKMGIFVNLFIHFTIK